jgi:hypothetical protein
LRLSEIRFRRNIASEKFTQPLSDLEYDLPCLDQPTAEPKRSLLLDGFEANPNTSWGAQSKPANMTRVAPDFGFSPPSYAAPAREKNLRGLRLESPFFCMT